MKTFNVDVVAVLEKSNPHGYNQYTGAGGGGGASGPLIARKGHSLILTRFPKDKKEAEQAFREVTAMSGAYGIRGAKVTNVMHYPGSGPNSLSKWHAVVGAGSNTVRGVTLYSDGVVEL